VAPRIRYPTTYSYKTETEGSYNEGNEFVPGASTTVTGFCIFSGSKNTILHTESGEVVEIVAQMIVAPTSALPIGVEVSVFDASYLVHDIAPTVDAGGRTHHKTAYLKKAGGAL